VEYCEFNFNLGAVSICQTKENKQPKLSRLNSKRVCGRLETNVVV